jgi:hypothetical protein
LHAGCPLMVRSWQFAWKLEFTVIPGTYSGCAKTWFVSPLGAFIDREHWSAPKSGRLDDTLNGRRNQHGLF